MIYTYSMQKDLAEVKALLSTVPLLSALGEEELLSLAGEFSSLALKAGQSLYSVGEPTDGLYLLARGKLQCLQESGSVKRACKASRSANAAPALFPTAHSSF